MEIKQKDKTHLILNGNRPKRRNVNERGHPNEKTLNANADGTVTTLTHWMMMNNKALTMKTQIQMISH